jgi:hypothetical protein
VPSPDRNLLPRKQQGTKNGRTKWPKNMKKCSPSLVIKEMQIRTTLRFHFNPTTNVGKDVGKKESSHTAHRNVS